MGLRETYKKYSPAYQTYRFLTGAPEEVGEDTIDTIVGSIPIPTPRQFCIAAGAIAGAVAGIHACKTFGEEIGKAEAEKIERKEE